MVPWEIGNQEGKQNFQPLNWLLQTAKIAVLLSKLYGTSSPKAWGQLRSERRAKHDPGFLPWASWKGSFTFSYCHAHGAAIHIFVLLFLNTFVSCKNFLLGCSGVECFDFWVTACVSSYYVLLLSNELNLSFKECLFTLLGVGGGMLFSVPFMIS